MSSFKLNMRDEMSLDLYEDSPIRVRDAAQLYEAKLTKKEIFENQIESDLEDQKTSQHVGHVTNITKSLEDMINRISHYSPVDLTPTSTSDSDCGGSSVKGKSKFLNKMVKSSPINKLSVGNVRRIVKKLERNPMPKFKSMKRFLEKQDDEELFIPCVKHITKDLEANRSMNTTPVKKMTCEKFFGVSSDSVKRMAEMFNNKFNPSSGRYTTLRNCAQTSPSRIPLPVVKRVKRQAPQPPVQRRSVQKPPVPRPRSFCSSECDSDASKPVPPPRKSKQCAISPKIRENMRLFEESTENKPPQPLKRVQNEELFEVLSVKDKIALYNRFLDEVDRASSPITLLPTPIVNPIEKPIRASLHEPTAKRKKSADSVSEQNDERLASLMAGAPPQKMRHIRVARVQDIDFMSSQYLKGMFIKWLENNKAPYYLNTIKEEYCPKPEMSVIEEEEPQEAVSCFTSRSFNIVF